MFGFLPYKIILDWYHLLEKVKQRLRRLKILNYEFTIFTIDKFIKV